MDKRTFIVAMAVEIPIAFVVLSILLNGRSDETFFIAWAAFAAFVLSLFVFLKMKKDENRKEKIRRNIALLFLTFIIVGVITVVAFVAAALFYIRF